MREEIFGPVLTAWVYPDHDAARAQSMRRDRRLTRSPEPSLRAIEPP